MKTRTAPRERTLESISQTALENHPVLIVEDEPALREICARAIERAGFEVVTAEDGETAAQMVVRRRFDVILSDIRMPQMSGTDLLRVIRAYDLDVPVVLMTGNPLLENAIEAVELGALQYLVKPIALVELVRVVQRASRLHRIAAIKRNALKLRFERGHEAGDRAGLHAGLDRALDQMEVAFQPIVDVVNRKVFAYEALLRSNEPTLPNPEAVIQAADKLDRLPEVGRRVRQLSAEAFRSAPRDALLFVNLHPKDLLDPSLYDDSSIGLMADRVVLEITERAPVEDVQETRVRVAALRARGYRLAVDDLGAGYAGLSSFAALEPDIVKLDMALVRGIESSLVKQRLVASMVTLCKDMQVRVIAEGVETVAERDTLRRLGCDLLQGYLLARPGPPFPAVAAFERGESAPIARSG